MVEVERFAALALFVTAMVGSPGPANIALMGAGAVAGFRAALPFFLGVVGGFLVLAVALAAGLSEVLTRWPALKSALLAAGTVYLFWLAWRLWTARPVAAATVCGSAPRFLEGLVVHPLNPKAWAMLIAANAQFVPAGTGATEGAAAVILAFILFGTPLNALWCAGGAVLARKGGPTGPLAHLNRVMAVLLVLSVLWALAA